MKRPPIVTVVMGLAGLIFATAIVGLFLNPRAVLLEARPWWSWVWDFHGYIVAPATCWALWKKRPSGRWWGLLLFAGFVGFAVFRGVYGAAVDHAAPATSTVWVVLPTAKTSGIVGLVPTCSTMPD